MQYFVTGATGFIGRFLVAELLTHADAQVFALVRPDSQAKLDALRERLGVTPQQLVAVHGNLEQSHLGLNADTLTALAGNIDHFFHLAALYDLKAGARAQEKANIGGTRNALDAAAALRARCFHHVSSIAAAGLYPGRFTETMFDEAIGLDDPYFFTKHASERLVREETRIPWRIYRPSLVVGDSRSGEIDKIDGPYYLFGILRDAGHWLPDWLPLASMEGGQFNIVPVNYVVQALDRIAHTPALDGQCFHLTADRDYTLAELLNLLGKKAGTPAIRFRFNQNRLSAQRRQQIARLFQIRPVQQLIHTVLDRLALPPSTLGFLTYPTTFDRRQTAAALAGTGIAPPAFDDYLDVVWRYWSRHLDP